MLVERLLPATWCIGWILIEEEITGMYHKAIHEVLPQLTWQPDSGNEPAACVTACWIVYGVRVGFAACIYH